MSAICCCSGTGWPGYGAASRPKSLAITPHSRCQRNTSPLATLKASLRAAGVVAAQALWRASRRASVTSLRPAYCVGEPGKTKGRPCALQTEA